VSVIGGTLKATGQGTGSLEIRNDRVVHVVVVHARSVGYDARGPVAIGCVPT